MADTLGSSVASCCDTGKGTRDEDVVLTSSLGMFAIYLSPSMDELSNDGPCGGVYPDGR